MNQYKIDLHTHSKLSPDGSIEEKDYQKVLDLGNLHALAITDHNAIDYAVYCQKKLGRQIIVGEEISTRQGHLIGLFLNKTIDPGKDVLSSAEEIKSQGGLVYIPHAYDFLRSGIGEKQLTRLLEIIDILEIFNGRVILPFFNTQANQFAEKYKLVGGFGSDSHFAGTLGMGSMVLSSMPSNKKDTFKNAAIHGSYNSFLGYFAPKYNRLKKLFNT